MPRIVPKKYVFWGIRGPGGKNERVSSWAYQGKDVPYTPLVSSRETIMQVMQTHNFLKLYQEAIAGPQASVGRIPIEKSRAALLMLSGKKDRLWPSTQMALEIVKQLDAVKYPHAYEHVSYDVGHNVPDEAPESWNKLFGFLKNHY